MRGGGAKPSAVGAIGPACGECTGEEEVILVQISGAAVKLDRQPDCVHVNVRSHQLKSQQAELVIRFKAQTSEK